MVWGGISSATEEYLGNKETNVGLCNASPPKLGGVFQEDSSFDVWFNKNTIVEVS